jgi:hypothetical protein
MKGIHDVVGAKVVVVKRIYVNGVFDFWDLLG